MLISALEGLPMTIGVKRLIELLSILDIMSTSKDIRHLSSLNYKSVTIDSEDKDRIETISRYVIKNIPEKIFLDEIASLVHLTPQSFCRYFKSKTNKVFSTFVNEIRIGNACKMIIENRHSISQICYKSGFNYLSNFNRQFQRIKGLTPSEFQSKYMNHNFDQN
jgi:AraC-like DNA-binding protein